MEIEQQNEDKELKIINVKTLKAVDKLDPTARHNSFVIQTHSPEAADKCLKKGLYINYRQYPAEKYTPQYQITQCFKCQGYGHRAAHCRGKETCAKCSKDHSTKECPNDVDIKCVNCGDNHQAWYHGCPTREHESSRLEGLKYLAKNSYFNE
jgi:hypothetical protein